MSVAITTSTTAAAIAASNSARMAAEKRENCEIYISSYQSIESPSVKQMQAYSECVSIVYPSEAQEASFKAVVGFIVLFSLFLVFVCGFIKSKFFNKYSDPYDVVLDGLPCLVIGWMVTGCVAALVYSFS